MKKLKKITIRRMEETDFERGFKTTLNRLTSVPDISTEEVQRVCRQNLIANHTVFVALDESDPPSVIGTATLVILPKFARGATPRGQLEDVVVNQEYSGQGIASALVNKVFEEARARGCYAVDWTCDRKNVAFYQRLGGEEHEVGMRKKLA